MYKPVQNPSELKCVCGVPYERKTTEGGLFLGYGPACNCVGELNKEKEKQKIKDETARVERLELERVSRIPEIDLKRLREGKFNMEHIDPKILEIQKKAQYGLNIIVMGKSDAGKGFDLNYLLYFSPIKDFYVLTPDQIIEIMYGRNRKISKADITECSVLNVDDIDKVNNESEIAELFCCLDMRSKNDLPVWCSTELTENLLPKQIHQNAFNRLKRRPHEIITKKTAIELTFL